MAPKYRLTYFNSRGLAELARLMFAYAKVPYEDIRIEQEQWPELKSKQPFGKLPVLEIDGYQLGETRAIFRYLSEELGLCGKSKLEAVRTEMILSALHDMLSNLLDWCIEQDPTKKAELLKKFCQDTLASFLPLLVKQFKANGTEYFVGNSLTIADLAVASAIDELEKRNPNSFDNFPDLAKHSERILNIPSIKEWIVKRPKTEL